MKLRAFLAFEIPDVVRRAVATLMHDLRQYSGEDVKWTAPEHMHVTMRFFGSVEASLLNGEIATRVARLAARYGPLTLDCSGVGVFPNWKYPRVIWVGFAGPTESLLHLHDELNHACAGLPIAADERQFRLHLTVARAGRSALRAALVKRVESLGPVQFGAVPVAQLTLYKSQLTKSGSVYTPLQTFNFQPKE
ncbi:MAG: RNA 2',3'-cyclic phosphodiesterase [Deltaproteobacteria bacterium]|nr:RNA 2',3'-cyclic phosphodiesterase [Deltaproteobacteria bacterium]